MPLNRLTTQRRLLQWAGGDAHGCSNDALVQSISNSGPDWADYGRAAFTWRDRRSSDHCVRTQGGPHAHHSRERWPSHLEYWCCRPAWVAAIRQLAGRQRASTMQWARETLFDGRVHRNYRGARSRRPLTRGLDGKSIASLVSGLRLVFVSRCIDLLQLAMRGLLRNLGAGHRAAHRDRKQATLSGRDADVAGRVLAPIRQFH